MPEPADAREPEAASSPLRAHRPSGVPEAAAAAPVAASDQPAAEPQPAPVREPEPAPAQAAQKVHAKPHKSGGAKRQFPGHVRRGRKAWAERRGFTYAKRDEFLVDEWKHGIADGSPLHDVVSGVAEGYEMHVMDMAGTPVMALRRPQSSDVVLDIERAEDGSFATRSSEPDTTDRLIDARFRAALRGLPAVVTGCWTESDWLLATMARGAEPEDFDAVLPPLAELADACTALPPRGGHAPEIDFDSADPSRPLPPPLSTEEAAKANSAKDEQSGAETKPAASGTDAAEAEPKVVRPLRPVQLPSRGRADSRGEVPLRSVGADEVDAIADKSEKAEVAAAAQAAAAAKAAKRGEGAAVSQEERAEQGAKGAESARSAKQPQDGNAAAEGAPGKAHEPARMLRRDTFGPSIFDDISAELGTDPLADLDDTEKNETTSKENDDDRK